MSKRPKKARKGKKPYVRTDPNKPRPMTERRLYIGIDPGKTSGAIAWVKDGKVLARAIPQEEERVLELLLDIVDDYHPREVVAAIEQIPAGAFPGSGKSAVAKLYASYKSMLMALAAVGLTPRLIPPGKWQLFVGTPKRKGESYEQFKRRLKEKALEIFPSMDITLRIADSLLIVHYIWSCDHEENGLDYPQGYVG